ncbi:hypothetical protein MLD38_026602 [Melastoma candidum]|uniref:Uncharacterized protein n=1 Tax=Melastoma candidum TaxID=119954 RepID=A0ACB9NZM2_9MYRT|nr:hypothetical protein MLD38_026602 [Melastoma candidum]
MQETRILYAELPFILLYTISRLQKPYHGVRFLDLRSLLGIERPPGRVGYSSSSSTSSAMVSRLGELEGFSGRITRGGATSSQHSFMVLSSLAILSTNISREALVVRYILPEWPVPSVFSLPPQTTGREEERPNIRRPNDK